MANELSIAERNALSVSYDVLGSHVELDPQFVKKYLVRGKADLVSDQEIILFMNTCKMLSLNPLVQGEVYLIKYSDADPATIQVGKGAYMRRAFEHQNYLSKSDGITVKRGNEIVQKEGCCLYPGEELLGGWCKVFYTRGQKECAAYKEVSLSEYNRGMANWKSKPATMINKVAISQCLREAFPKDYMGVYSEEELVASGVVPADADTNGTGAAANPVEIVETITQGQRQELFKKARERFGERGNEILLAIIAELGFTSTTDMPVDVWERVMLRIDEWTDNPSAGDDSAA
jgi:phage recombination protein Bet